MRIVLDVQHAGKPDSPRDRGAPLGPRSEVWATRRLGLAMEEMFDALGHEVFVLRDGSYADRHKRCDALAPDLYVALHFDAGIGGRGDRGAVFHWPGSAKGKAAADKVAAHAGTVCPWGVRALVAEAGKWDRVRACVGGVKAPAILLELGFCDGEKGATWLQMDSNLVALGQAVARAVVS
jgi:N-acetylmuramoyl-L-alanine amidase